MDNKTKDDRISGGCPHCSVLLFKNFLLVGDKSESEIICYKCGKPVNIKAFRKTVVVITKVVVIAIIATVIFLKPISGVAKKVGCSLFRTQNQAQAVYNQNPQAHKSLDGYDKDGRVCEHLPIKEVK